MIFHRDLESNQRVCPHCSHHFRVGPDYHPSSPLIWVRSRPIFAALKGSKVIRTS
jgi:hypothetical protein